MSESTKISLKAARVNANLSQEAAAHALTQYFGIKISRQRIATLEKNPDEVSPGFAEGFSKIYKIPIRDISFTSN